MASTYSSSVPFGRVVTAMVTPFSADGALDLDGARELARQLVESGSSALVVNGTTGESPTTSAAEKTAVLKAVIEAVGDRARVIGGIGGNNTAHVLEEARAVAEAGAHAILAVTPYYNKPPQEGVYRHFTAVADATELPVMLYDIPGRTATPIATETLLRLAEHPRITAVKDAKGDLAASSRVMAETDLAYYCGDDALNLPFAAVGAVGTVSVVSHLVGPELNAMYEAFFAGDVAKARDIHRMLLPVFTGVFRTQGVITVKAALRALGRPGGPVRLPQIDLDEAGLATLRADLAAAGIAI
ncbi:4-hydroxy-tetrahydrodipicolinate synthase [Actinospica sp. MGRD01-02]|uniref:4-hydroxy-tetrahydrodipicolinate synthase n=1 Tax=Actinospica acidithermotolerans TaxID=2828514 RepID=A0A941E6Y5_9ACTN|nr:4-hydroxy-tetrahydrodipicolinate synthase [Actinospica acidithermotolerans]MBR7827480.1 4-hydroxy-tetrahydrodipicolinate synthase [Actinospica acidithermotolerans]